jgi:hypothetical protein
MKKAFGRLSTFFAAMLLAFATPVSAQSGTPLNNPAPFQAGTALLLTNGTVMVQQMNRLATDRHHRHSASTQRIFSYPARFYADDLQFVFFKTKTELTSAP